MAKVDRIMQAEGRARQSKGPHGSLLRVGEKLRESLQVAAQGTTNIRRVYKGYCRYTTTTITRWR